MTSSPELQPLASSDEDEGNLDTQRQTLDSAGESYECEEDSQIKAAQEFVTSYCQAFDSPKHAGLVDLMAPDSTFEWFGQEVHGCQTLQQFIRANIPDTRHLSVTVEPGSNVQEPTEQLEYLIENKRKRERITSVADTNVVLVHGKLQFSRKPSAERKAKKQWKWERNFKLQVSYSSDISPKLNSPENKWQIQKVVYEQAGQCRRALFD